MKNQPRMVEWWRMPAVVFVRRAFAVSIPEFLSSKSVGALSPHAIHASLPTGPL